MCNADVRFRWWATSEAFAAIKERLQHRYLGPPRSRGGDSDSVRSQLTVGVRHVVGNGHVFAAVKEDGSVVTWGDAQIVEATPTL